MKPVLPNSLFWKVCLLLLAAALFTLSFVFNKLYTNRSSVAGEVKSAERYLYRQQKDFNAFLCDTSLIEKLVNDSESIQEFEKIAAKKYGIFLYKVTSDGLLTMSFWSNQLILPPPETYALGNMEDFMHLSNGYYLVIKQSLSLSSNTIVAYAMIPVRSLPAVQWKTKGPSARRRC